MSAHDVPRPTPPRPRQDPRAGRRELEAARAVATDPEDLRQLLHWQRRLERRGRKPKPPPQEPKTVPMFSELEEIES